MIAWLVSLSGTDLLVVALLVGILATLVLRALYLVLWVALEIRGRR